MKSPTVPSPSHQQAALVTVASAIATPQVARLPARRATRLQSGSESTPAVKYTSR